MFPKGRISLISFEQKVPDLPLRVDEKCEMGEGGRSAGDRMSVDCANITKGL